MTEEQIQKEIQKPIGAALSGLEWFLVFSFVDHAMKQDNMFTSQEDAEALSVTIKRLHDQVFPPKKDSLVELEEALSVKKELITAPQTLII